MEGNKENKMFIKEWIDEHLITKKEAMDITGQSRTSFNQSLYTERIKPFYEHGSGRGMIRLYLKEDMIEYKHKKDEYLKKINRL